MNKDIIISQAEMVTRLLDEKQFTALRAELERRNAADVAALFDELPAETLPLLFRLLPKELAADTFVEMDSDAQRLLIKGFSDSELKEVVEELYVDDAVDIVEEMPANVVVRILDQADPDTRKMINEIMRYPEDSAGSIMTTEFVALRENYSVEDAIKRLRRTAVEAESIDVCYVIKPDRMLVGYITIRTLIVSPADAQIGKIMQSDVISVSTGEDKETVAQIMQKYNFSAIPVVDGDNRLAGIVTIDDAVDVLQDEATEDIQKMAAITPSDKPYLKTNAFAIYRHRIPWLMLLMVSATFTGMIITRFENALAACVTLTAYIPMLMDTGGNSGSQASVTVIRSLSLNEIRFRDILQVVFKEFQVSIMCAVTLAVCNFAKLMLIDKVGLMVSTVVCLSLMVTVVIAKLIGCSLPMFAKKLGFDPVVMASPFITTLVDALSLLVYFGIASHVLQL